jgi:6-phosphogluconolactonase
MIHVVRDEEQLALVGTRLIGALLRGRLRSGSRPITLVLSGGRTPRGVYETMAGERGDRVPWDDIRVMWVDERCVPPDDERSNYRLAESAGLLARPWAGVYRMPGELPPEEGARAYETTLRDLFPGKGLPRLDVVLLGLGEDGHVASLFAGSAELYEPERLVMATKAQGGVRRLTLTFSVLANARNLLFLVTGEAKAEAVRLTLGEAEPGPISLPGRLLLEMVKAKTSAGLQHPTVTWVLDEAAASGLPAPGLLDGGPAPR